MHPLTLKASYSRAAARYVRTTSSNGFLNRGWWRFLAIALAATAVLATLVAFNPAGSGIFPPCPFHALTGLYCPGCGTLRALHQLLHGRSLQALGLNPLMVMSLPFLGYALASETFLATVGRRLPGVRLPASWIWALLAAIILFWIFRNIPVYPFTILAP